MGYTTRVVLVAIVSLFACGEPMPPPVMTASTISSPGPLAAAHETIACESCHASASAETSNDKCLDCHSPIRDRIVANKGLHGSLVARTKLCSTCHSDHKGRGYDILGWKSIARMGVCNGN